MSTNAPEPPAAIVGAPVDTVSWSPTGRFIAAACALCSDPRNSRPVLVWDLWRGRLQRVFAADDFDGRGGSVRFSPNERYLAVGAHDSVRVWRMEDGERVFEGRAIATYGGFSFSPDSSRLIWGNVFGLVWLQDIDGRRLIREGQMHSGAASFGVGFDWDAALGEVTITTENVGRVRWNSTTGADMAAPPAASWGLPFAVDDLASAETHDGAVWVGAHANGLLALQRRGGPVVILRRATRAPAPSEWLGVTLRDDGQWVTLVGQDGRVEVWELAREAGRTLFEGERYANPSVDAQFSPDGRFLVVERGGQLFTHVLGTAAPTLPLGPLSTAGESASIAGWLAGGWLVVRTSAGRLFAYNATTAEHREQRIDTAASLSFSSDGRFMAIASPNLTLVRASDGHTVTLVAQRDESDALIGAPQPSIGEAAMAAFMRGAP